MSPVRSSGILLHPTSLPGRFGIGDLGAAAYRFVDDLAAAGQRIWQVLPLGPTGPDGSPYQGISAFAGNELLIDLDDLVRRGWLESARLDAIAPIPVEAAAFAEAGRIKRPLLAAAHERFLVAARSSDRARFDTFCEEQREWLDDHARFSALREAHDGLPWTEWEPEIAARQDEIDLAKFVQFVFFEQWLALKRHARGKGVRIFGDLPIYVAHDSADVWSCRELFRLDATGRPTVVAGVPPDYFSETGQRWGNPIWDWDALAADGYRWWIRRLEAAFRQTDLVRVDHFRGFEAYWEIPVDEETAVGGRWVPGPGAALFEAARTALGELPIVAENLGDITPEVEALRERLGFPGMAILQFAFGSDVQADSFLPHNYDSNLVAYSGTHDNNTVVGWWSGSEADDSTRSEGEIRGERERAADYLALGDRPIHWTFIETLMASPADTVIFPLQDVLGLGSEARMNRPGRDGGNWTWRFADGALTPEIRERLRGLAEDAGRL